MPENEVSAGDSGKRRIDPRCPWGKPKDEGCFGGWLIKMERWGTSYLKYKFPNLQPDKREYCYGQAMVNSYGAFDKGTFPTQSRKSEGFLRTTLRRCALDLLKRNNPTSFTELRLPQDDEAFETEDTIIDGNDSLAVWFAWETIMNCPTLTEREKTIMMLKWQGHSQTEIAQMLGELDATVSRDVGIARQKVQQYREAN